jgi:hypothetical protein
MMGRRLDYIYDTREDNESDGGENTAGSGRPLSGCSEGQTVYSKKGQPIFETRDAPRGVVRPTVKRWQTTIGQTTVVQ